MDCLAWALVMLGIAYSGTCLHVRHIRRVGKVGSLFAESLTFLGEGNVGIIIAIPELELFEPSQGIHAVPSLYCVLVVPQRHHLALSSDIHQLLSHPSIHIY